MPSPRTTIRPRQTLKAALKGLAGKRGYRPIRTGRRALTTEVKESFPQPPASWTGTLPEWAIYWAHLQLGLKVDQDFEYIPRLQRVMGAQKGLQVDFLELDLPIAIDINGLFWHYGFGAAKIVADLETRARVESIGLTYVVIDEDDAIADPIFYLREARLGREHSRVASGL